MQTKNNEIIKSVRVYEARGIIHLDYRLQEDVTIPHGHKDRRIRFSTGKRATKIAMNKMEKSKFIFASGHYYNLMDKMENKTDILFEDIAYDALREAEADRRKDDGSRDYRNILEADVLPTFGELSLKSIKPKDIKDWQVLMGEENISQSRFNKRFYVLKRVLDYAMENSYIENNPINYVKRTSKLFKKAQKKSHDYFNVEEMEKLLSYVYEGDNARELRKSEFIVTFLHVLFLTGCRTGEAMALKWDDIDFEKSSITISRSIRKGIISTTKTDEVREIPMVGRLKKALLKWEEQKKRSEYVFHVYNKKTPYSETRSIVDSMYKPLLKKLGIPYRIMYNSRHTFASLAVENGVSIATVAQCLGHSTTMTTQRFYVRMGNLNLDNARNELENGLSA